MLYNALYMLYNILLYNTAHLYSPYNKTFPNSCRRMPPRSEEHTSELQSRPHLVCRLLLEKKKLFYGAGGVSRVARTHELIVIALRRQRLRHIFVGQSQVVHLVPHDMRMVIVSVAALLTVSHSTNAL